jgi:hypothetical protein
MKRYVLAAALAIVSAVPASAYTSYLQPSDFWPDSASVTIEGAFASQFFTPQIALPNQFTVLYPDGARASFESVAVAAQATTMEARFPRGGTYRVSTGEQVGGVSTLLGIDGSWRPLAPGEIPPEGTQTTTLQAVTLADVYITRGGPTRQVVDRAIGRLAIRPVTHPNQVLAANGFEIELLFDDAPVANIAVVLYAAGDPDNKLDRFVATDANGRATFVFDAPGQYVIAARHRATAPAGSEAAVRSYTTTLTFEALAELPAIVEVAEDVVDEPSRRRRRQIGRQD